MITSLSPSSATSLLIHALRPNPPKPHHIHLPICSITKPPPNPNPNLPTRRDASLALAALSLTFILPHPSLAADSPPNSCSFTIAPSGLAFCDRVLGNGPAAASGQLIKAHYVGRLESGKVFDSSYGRGQPLTFRIGVGEVIKGWDQGILGGDGIPPMLAGGKRTLKLPPELGYGVRGAGCRGVWRNLG